MLKTNKSVITLDSTQKTRQKPGAKPGKAWQEKYKNRKKRPTRYTHSKSFKTTSEDSQHIKNCAKSLGMSESGYLRELSKLPLETVKTLLCENLTK